MNGPALLMAALFTVGASAIGAQEFAVEVEKPAFAAGSGPLVLWDAAHHNAHHWEMTAFHEVLRKDGFNLAFQTERWTPAALEAAAILVVPGPLALQRESLWVKGANHYWWSDEGRQSAFTADEVAAAVRWVRRGGSLLLILDHAPSADAARLLSEALGVEVRNSMTWDDGRRPPAAGRRATSTRITGAQATSSSVASRDRSASIRSSTAASRRNEWTESRLTSAAPAHVSVTTMHMWHLCSTRRVQRSIRATSIDFTARSFRFSEPSCR